MRSEQAGPCAECGLTVRAGSRLAHLRPLSSAERFPPAGLPGELRVIRILDRLLP